MTFSAKSAKAFACAVEKFCTKFCSGKRECMRKRIFAGCKIHQNVIKIIKHSRYVWTRTAYDSRCKVIYLARYAAYNMHYGGFREIPQKVCGGDILHLMTYAFFLKCPKIEHIQFRCFSRFKIDHVFFLEIPHFFMLKNLEMPHFYLILKMGKEPKMNM